MWETISNVFNYTLIHATIRASTPIMIASIAAIVSKQADIFNIAIEGIMLFGAFTAMAVSFSFGSWILGLGASIIVGLLVAAIIGIAYIKYKGNIVVIGISINLLALAVTRFLLQNIYGVSGSLIAPGLKPLPRLNIAAFENNPVLKSLFSGYSLFEILGFVMVIVMWFVLYKTIWGLRLRSVGLYDQAAKTAGIDVNKKRFQAILLSGVFAGIAGAHLSLGYSTMFTENMTNGRGFMAIAAMNFGNGNPIGALMGCLIFGFSDSVGARLQSYGVPSQLILLIPYVVTVAVLGTAMANFLRRERREKSALTSGSKE